MILKPRCDDLVEEQGQTTVSFGILDHTAQIAVSLGIFPGDPSGYLQCQAMSRLDYGRLRYRCTPYIVCNGHILRYNTKA
jgi:hypothetical protein